MGRWLAILPVLVLLCGTLAAQTPVVLAVLNDASREPRLCPGARAEIQLRDVARDPVSVQIGGRTALVMGRRIVDLADYWTVQIPMELSPGPTTMIVRRGDAQAEPFPVSVETFAPALYRDIWLDSGLQSVIVGFFPPTSLPFAAPGEILRLWALCLGPTNPPVPTGFEGQKVPTAFAASVRLGGQPAEVLESYHAELGRYEVRFRVPQGLADATHPLAIETGGQTSNTRNLVVTRAPIIHWIRNAASFEQLVAPGSIASIFGENLGTRDQLTGFPATEFQGISVTVNGLAAPLLHLIGSAKQINFQVPAEVTGSLLTVNVRSALGAGPGVMFPLSPVALGIFRLTHPSQPLFIGNAAALLGNTAWRVMPRALARVLGIPDSCAGRGAAEICGQPAMPGDVIQVYLTGLGKATVGGDPAGRPLGTGEVAPADGNPVYLTVGRPEAFIGVIRAEVLFSGVAPGFAGLYQVNVRIPTTAPIGDDVPLTITVPRENGGRGDRVTLAIQR